jgi:hypothetical protein
MLIFIIIINEIIEPIKIKIVIKEKTVIKNISLGTVAVSTSPVDEFISGDNDSSVYLSSSFIQIILETISNFL